MYLMMGQENQESDIVSIPVHLNLELTTKNRIREKMFFVVFFVS